MVNLISGDGSYQSTEILQAAQEMRTLLRGIQVSLSLSLSLTHTHTHTHIPTQAT